MTEDSIKSYIYSNISKMFREYAICQSKAMASEYDEGVLLKNAADSIRVTYDLHTGEMTFNYDDNNKYAEELFGRIMNVAHPIESLANDIMQSENFQSMIEEEVSQLLTDTLGGG